MSIPSGNELIIEHDCKEFNPDTFQYDLDNVSLDSDEECEYGDRCVEILSELLASQYKFNRQLNNSNLTNSLLQQDLNDTQASVTTILCSPDKVTPNESSTITTTGCPLNSSIIGFLTPFNESTQLLTEQNVSYLM
uniref:Uncharacterized protein n=1 Tax=Rhabditophanes sp. KR3021 TaxID=114890 RepID=A0AC35TQF6_9BILA